MDFHLSNRQFVVLLLTACGLYLSFEWFMNSYLMLSVDDFWFAHHAYQYKFGLPYRDFSPYKTVLGYYFLLIPLSLFNDGLNTLFYTKHAIAVLNASIIFFAACWLTRFFAKPAILLSIALLIISENVLSYSTNIRVDMFAYWFGLFAVLSLLERRFILSGLLLGLGFITSQKMVWYVFAGNIMLLVDALVLIRTSPSIGQQVKKYLHTLCQLNIACALVIVLYLFFWLYLSSAQTVIQSIWYDAAAMYQLDWYNAARATFWRAVICQNPILFLLWPFSFITLMISYEDDYSYHARLLITVFSLIILGCLIPYKQVFPYYMQAAYPVFILLYSSLFTWFMGLIQSAGAKQLLLGKMGLITGCLGYSLLILFFCFKLDLPLAYLLVLSLPVLLGSYVLHPNLSAEVKRFYRQLLSITFIFLALIYPTILLIPKIYYTNNAYQKQNIALAAALLKEGGDYVAGLDLFFNRNQPINGLKHLMGPAIDYLYMPKENLRKVMLAALDEDPNVTQASVIAALNAAHVKFYMNNYRIDALPESIKTYLSDQYQHFWGSIYLYAPTIKSGTTDINIKFTGRYQLQSQDLIIFDGHAIAMGTIFPITTGLHTITTTHDCRLKLIPQINNLLLRGDRPDEWARFV